MTTALKAGAACLSGLPPQVGASVAAKSNGEITLPPKPLCCSVADDSDLLIELHVRWYDFNRRIRKENAVRKEAADKCKMTSFEK